MKVLEKKYFRTNENAYELIKEICEYIKGFEFEHIGIASFGPICLNKEDSEYGSITTTPKIGWNDFNVVKNVA